MSTDNGEPAFPRSYLADGHNGMTLRDYFAAQALPALINAAEGYLGEPQRLSVALDAYKVANAMLKARGVMS